MTTGIVVQVVSIFVIPLTFKYLQGTFKEVYQTSTTERKPVATFTKYEAKRGTSWMVRIRKNGKSFTETFPTKKMGQEWATKMENAIIEQAHFPERTTPAYHSIGELIDTYTERMLPQLAPKTQKTHRTILRWWKKQLADTAVTTVNPRLIEDYKHLLLRKHKAATTNLYLNVLSSA